jgi:hypothetical protein
MKKYEDVELIQVAQSRNLLRTDVETKRNYRLHTGGGGVYLDQMKDLIF